MQDPMFYVGQTAIRHDGVQIKIESIHNGDTDYETVRGTDGKHRYNRGDYGRCTGTDWEVPSKFNLEIPADQRHLVTYIPEKSSIDRADSCSCGCKILRAERNFAGRIHVRCLACGKKSTTDSSAWNAVNHWNNGEFQ